GRSGRRCSGAASRRAGRGLRAPASESATSTPSTRAAGWARSKVASALASAKQAPQEDDQRLTTTGLPASAARLSGLPVRTFLPASVSGEPPVVALATVAAIEAAIRIAAAASSRRDRRRLWLSDA